MDASQISRPLAASPPAPSWITSILHGITARWPSPSGRRCNMDVMYLFVPNLLRRRINPRT